MNTINSSRVAVPPMTGIAALAVSCVLALTCCERAEKTVVRYRSEVDLKTLEAPVGGTWSLYEADAATPKLKVTIDPGTPIGFEVDDESGRLLAVAGEMATALPTHEAEYYWAHE